MKIVCPHCSKAYRLQKERLPKKRHFAIPCPNCKEPISVDLNFLDGEGSIEAASVSSKGEEVTGEALKALILKSIRDLPPMPQTILKAQEIMRDANYSFEALSKVLETDQALAAKVLKMANSPFYGLMGKVSSLQHASVVLGQKTLEELITMAGASDLLGGRLEGYELDSGDLWVHSMGVAFASKLIAIRKQPALENDAFAAGLIHDAGKLALDPYILERKQAFKAVTEDSGESFTVAEKRILGFDHAELALELCKHWNVPEPLRIAIGCHHNPESSDGNILAYIVHLADAVAMMSGMGAGLDGMQYSLSEQALDTLGFTEDEINEIMAEAVQSVQGLTEETQ
ncbi:MAG: zinc-ribbon domain-containing protein [Deltaproteobacteria bacterium]|nr:zinc-ribbon domain-containing protein [Deltaproteobacteria bacterium]